MADEGRFFLLNGSKNVVLFCDCDGEAGIMDDLGSDDVDAADEGL